MKGLSITGLILGIVAADAGVLAPVPPERRQALLDTLAQDPRPGYQHEPERVYGMLFAGCDVLFTVEDGVLTVREVHPAGSGMTGETEG